MFIFNQQRKGTKMKTMYVLRATEKPRWAKRNSDEFYYRDRGRQDCEGTDKATKFESYEDAEKVCTSSYEIEEI
jgi:hypothetical protein